MSEDSYMLKDYRNDLQQKKEKKLKKICANSKNPIYRSNDKFSTLNAGNKKYITV